MKNIPKTVIPLLLSIAFVLAGCAPKRLLEGEWLSTDPGAEIKQLSSADGSRCVWIDRQGQKRTAVIHSNGSEVMLFDDVSAGSSVAFRILERSEDLLRLRGYREFTLIRQER